MIGGKGDLLLRRGLVRRRGDDSDDEPPLADLSAALSADLSAGFVVGFVVGCDHAGDDLGKLACLQRGV
jgi:hypothetical protein